MERDAVGFVPLQRVQKDVLGFVRSRKDARQENAVVVAVWLVAKNNHLETVAAASCHDFFEQTRSRHPIPNNDQPFFVSAPHIGHRLMHARGQIRVAENSGAWRHVNKNGSTKMYGPDQSATGSCGAN